jgi:TonB family protein
MNTMTFDGGAKRQFVVPAAIVLSAHAALFLGFVKNPPVITLRPKYMVIHEDLLPPPVIEESGQDVDKSAGGGPSRPHLPDIPNPVALNRPDMPGIPITPELPGIPVALPGPWLPGNPGRPIGPVGLTVSPDLLDHAPEAVRQPQPIYPTDAKNRGESGEVVVTFVVDELGRVLNPRVVSSSDPIFEQATIRAIGQWRFAPGTLHGVRVRFRMSVPVAFHLDR